MGIGLEFFGIWIAIASNADLIDRRVHLHD